MADPKHAFAVGSAGLYVGNGATPEIFTKIPKVDVWGDSPLGEPGKLEVTNDDATSLTKSYIDDWAEPSEKTFECFWDSTDPTQTQLLTDSEASPRTTRNYQQLYSNGVKYTWPAYPIVKPIADLKGALKLSVKLIATGGAARS